MADEGFRSGMSNRAALGFLWRQAGPGRLAVLAALMVASSLTEGFGLLLLVPITQLVAEGGATSGPAWLAPLARLPLEALLVCAVALVGLRTVTVYATNERRRMLGLALARRLRKSAHEAVMRADWRWLSQQGSADHAALIMGESARIASLANQAVSLATATVTIAALVVSAALISWPLTLLVLAASMVAAGLLAVLKSRDDGAGERFADAYHDMQQLVSNGLRHLRAARIAGAESGLAQRFDATNAELVELEQHYARTSHRAVMIIQLAAALILAGLVYLALKVWALPLAVFLPVIAIFARIAPLAGSVHESLRGWRFTRPALARLIALIDEARGHEESASGDAIAPAFERAIELQNIVLRYEGRDEAVLDGFDLIVPFGQTVAIAGTSGSGKSSLADLLGGLIAPDSGSILIDGEPLEHDARTAWRSQVAYLEQAPFFLEGTIAENLSWGREDLSEQDLWRALDLASAGFVNDLPLGLATRMGEGGYRLSGGERQRIALARALLAKPRLLILDEVTAALDDANAAEIMRSIDGLRGSCAIVILTHDERLMQMADSCIAIDGESPIDIRAAAE